tara:strand:+ start:6617 stop:7075 length:459 start_codon:yes stop_codon:yes gene_type:complete
MDINRIFNLFNNSDDDEFKSPIREIMGDTLDFNEFKDTPPYYIGMFEKMILNHNNVKNQVVNLFKKSNEEFNIEEIEEAGEFMAYNRAWDYIKNCDLNDLLWSESLLLRNSEYFITAIKLAINYFEGYEEYEKCALLKTIQLFLEDNLAPKS